MGLGEGNHTGKMLSSHQIQVTIYQHVFHCWWWTRSSDEECLSGFSSVKLLLSPTFQTVPFGRKLLWVAHDEWVGIDAPSVLEDRISTLFGIILHGRFTCSLPLIYSVTCLCQSRHRDMHSVFWVITRYCLIYFVAQIIPALASWERLSPFHIPPLLCVLFCWFWGIFEPFFIVWPYKMLQAPLVWFKYMFWQTYLSVRINYCFIT